ncbi:peroxisomal acyl-coenzyme A oxidase 1 [Nematostella vectensis]|uniref:peroxisomal acyl-coenzyme A oxidase 1 n=1 Tax=Nematostella vectensis TaxID=45351 RepID=UPI0020772598|nr:peroxisomal acyl-coenzyme A oxidase 1 [Nematostella vectensis]
MNPDIARERSQASFSVQELINLLDGGKQNTERRRYVESLLSQEPLFQKEQDFFLSREEAFDLVGQRALRVFQIVKENKITSREDNRHLSRGIDLALPSELHRVMFMPTIKLMGTKEQQEKWLPLAEMHQILGTFAQTELGHGTFVRGLETTATYDKQTQQFVLHSPSLTASKWWPGNLGHSTNYCIVVARLIIDDKEYGLHYFLLQTRDLKTHQPLPGVTIGEIGPKTSRYYNVNDNGFLLLDHVRVPREQMLMGLAQVNSKGEFIRKSSKGGEKAVYAPMMLIRAGIPFNVFYQLSRAMTIAIRYSTVRRQSEIKPGQGEVQILDYKSQQDKLFPGLALAYATWFAASGVYKEFLNQSENWSKGNFSFLQELHALTSGMKAFSTSRALGQVETCRLACGGHGFSAFSNLSELHDLISAGCTYEGENTVLMLQVARFLVKCVAKGRNGSDLHSTVTYLKGAGSKGTFHTTADEFLDPRVQVELYREASFRLVTDTEHRLKAKVKSGIDPAIAFNELSVDLIRCANAHMSYLVVKYFIEALDTDFAKASHPIKSVLKSVCDIFALHGISEESGRFLEVSVITPNQVAIVRDQIMELFSKIRPDAVALVDAFDYSDFVLNSALGRYDGQVYQRLFELAQKSELNKKKVQPSAKKYLQELQKSKL